MKWYEWYLDVLKNRYAAFNGRARRAEYWFFFLCNILVSFVIGFVITLVAGETASSLVSGIYSLAVLIPGIALGIRRMHDTNHSGWWILCPIVNFVFACLDSQPETNRFGPNPKGTSAIVVPGTVNL